MFPEMKIWWFRRAGNTPNFTSGARAGVTRSTASTSRPSTLSRPGVRGRGSTSCFWRSRLGRPPPSPLGSPQCQPWKTVGRFSSARTSPLWLSSLELSRLLRYVSYVKSSHIWCLSAFMKQKEVFILIGMREKPLHNLLFVLSLSKLRFGSARCQPCNSKKFKMNERDNYGPNDLKWLHMFWLKCGEWFWQHNSC